MRHRADDPTIGISCGHRVPRIPVARHDARPGGGNQYWCEECGAYRMSGGKTSGVHGHAYLFALRDLVEQIGVVVPDVGSDRGRRTVEALGAHCRSAA